MFRRQGKMVHSFFGRMAPMFLAAAIAVPVVCNGCAARVRVYDPYYHDYHAWAAEGPYYSQWEHDSHREHMDFDKRSKEDQKAYWDWRHNQH